MMNSSINFSSSPGVGSKFWITIPIVKSVDEKPHFKDIVNLLHAPGSEEDISVLYIEDNSVNYLLMESIFSDRSGYILTHAKTACAGLCLAQTIQPDIIIMDINLPDISGKLACEILKRNQSTCHIPIIALTGDVVNHATSVLEDRNFFRAMFKPFDVDHLFSAIEETLSADAQGL